MAATVAAEIGVVLVRRHDTYPVTFEAFHLNAGDHGAVCTVGKVWGLPGIVNKLLSGHGLCCRCAPGAQISAGRRLRRRTSASGWTGQRKNGQPWQRKKAKKRAYNGVSFHCVS